LFHSLRTRLTFWYGSILLTCLLAFTAWIWVSVSSHMADIIDARIATRVQGLLYTVREASDESANALHEELREFAKSSEEGNLIAVKWRRGQLLQQSMLPEDRIWGLPDGRIVDFKAANVRYRAFRSHSTIQDESYDFVVATSCADADHFLANFRLLLISAVPIVALISGLAGLWMSHRALAPVDELTLAVRRISLENLSERLNVPKTGDELERLGNTWNEMLGRLAASVDRMRQFTADASHELRTPIAVIRTTAELALRRDRPDADYRKSLESVRLEAEWMGQLAEDLLLLARSDSGTMKMRSEPVSIDDLAREAARETAPMAEARGISMRSDLNASGRLIEADGRALRRVLTILLENAVQHTPPEGEVAIETGASDREIRVDVSDTGEGIRGEDLPHIFERFYRGDPARSRQNGAGLGLAIAKAITEAHGAQIKVETERGQGTRFSIRFPNA
jgi:heavy metal sensor kinase